MKLQCPALFSLLLISFTSYCHAQAASKRFFTVRDDIELRQFGDVYSGVREDIITSPRGDMVIVHTTRGVLKDDSVRDELRVYEIAAIRRFVDSSGVSEVPRPTWTIEQSVSSRENAGPVVSNIRWLSDEGGFAFLAHTQNGSNRLQLAQLRGRSLIYLTPASQDVLSFDIRDERHFAYTVAASGVSHHRKTANRSPVSVGTGRLLNDLIFAESKGTVRRGELWSVEGKSRFPVRDRVTNTRIVLFEDGIDALSLAPDGLSLVTIRPLAEVPQDWEKKFPPPYPEATDRLRAGYQDLKAPYGWYVGDYVRIDLSSGEVKSLTNAPAAERTGWWEEGSARPAWSGDGSRILLPGTFVSGVAQTAPCVLVEQLRSGETECVRKLRENLAHGFAPGFDPLSDISFVAGSNEQIILTGSVPREGGHQSQLFVRSSSGTWNNEPLKARVDRSGLDLRIVETFKDPPLLVALDPRTGARKTVFDPNPQLNQIEFGRSELYQWSDWTGRSWQGILYLPENFHQGIQYPLVIENHGFSEDRFRPSGGFPSAFVASELSAAGIMVLHVRDCPGRGNPTEGMCNVEEYKAAVDALSSAGMIDRARIGLIGFSRTVFYVLKALTSNDLHVAAASITDGITGGYWDYVCAVGPDNLFASDAEALVGAMPIGEGLSRWLDASPDFHMDEVEAPLRVVATTGRGVLEMWEPYALLERMHRPVDLIVLNTHEHVFSDPDLRLAAQGGNVDWFRFWLQGYEDPDPSKLSQYARWEKLRAEQPRIPKEE